MAISASGLTSGSSLTDATSYNTASVTPSADALVLLAVAYGDTNVSPTITGNGLTWVEIHRDDFPADAEPTTAALFRTMGASPSAGAITIDFGATTQLRCAWSVLQFTGVDTSGTNGSGAVVQTATNRAGGAASITATLAAFADAVNNVAFGAIFRNGVNGASAITPGSGFTEIHDIEANEGGDSDVLVETEWKTGEDTSVDGSTAVNGGWMAVALEIKAAAAGRTTRNTRSWNLGQNAGLGFTMPV